MRIIWKAIATLSERFSLFALDVSLQYLDICFCYEVFLLYRLFTNLCFKVIQLC